MGTQTVEFRAAPGLTLTAKLFTPGNDTIVQTASAVTEATNRKGTYAATFTDPGAAEFELIALSGTTPVARWFCTLTLTTATFQAYEVRVSSVVNSVGSINGVTFPANFGTLGINSSGHLLRLVLCDTTTTNSDMRGTDGAALASNYTAGRAQYLDNLNVGGPVASQADVNALNQSASRRVTLATVVQYERPDTGSTGYTVEARTYDGDGNAVNADSTPTLTATGSVTGSLSGNLGSATNPATGVYRWTYTVANSATLEQVRYDLSATISAATFTQSAFTQVTDLVSATWTSTDASRLLAVYNKLPSRSYLTGATVGAGELVPGDIWNQLPSAGWTNGSFGDRVLIGANTNRSPQVTGAGHIAADVHEFQPGVLTAADTDATFQAMINAQVLDVLATDLFTELSTIPAASSSLKDKITFLFMLARNKMTSSSTTATLFRDDGTTTVGTSPQGELAGVFTRGEFS